MPTENCSLPNLLFQPLLRTQLHLQPLVTSLQEAIMVVIHGMWIDGVQVTDPGILEMAVNRIENKKIYIPIYWNTMRNPKSTEAKECTLQWRYAEGGALISDRIREPEVFNFNSYITMIKYGGVELLDKPDVYIRLHQARRRKEGLILNNDSLGGDPKPNEQKRIVVTIVHKDWAHSLDSDYPEGDRYPMGW